MFNCNNKEIYRIDKRIDSIVYRLGIDIGSFDYNYKKDVTRIRDIVSAEVEELKKENLKLKAVVAELVDYVYSDKGVKK